MTQNLAIHYATQQAETEVVRLLLTLAGPDQLLANTEMGFLPIHFAAMTGDTEMVQLFLRDREDDIVAAQLLANDTPGGFTVLHFACMEGHVEIIRTALSCGPEEQIQVQDEEEALPIHRACLMGCVEAVQLLVNKGGVQQLAFKTAAGSLPVSCASQEGQSDIIRYFYQLDPAQLTAPDGDGALPIHYASLEGQENTVQLLLDLAGPEQLGVMNHEMQSAADWAAMGDHHDLAQHLIALHDQNKGERMATSP